MNKKNKRKIIPKTKTVGKIAYPARIKSVCVSIILHAHFIYTQAGLFGFINNNFSGQFIVIVNYTQ